MSVHGSGKLLGERALAGEDFVEHEPERIDVAARAHFSSGKLFRRHVGRSPTADFVTAYVVSETCQAKVSDDDLTASIQHDVGGVQIAVQHALGMGRGESG